MIAHANNLAYLDAIEKVDSSAGPSQFVNLTELNMYKSLIATSALLGIVALLPVWAQTATAPSAAPNANSQRVQAGLLTTVKAAKAKTNDPITAQTVTPFTLKDGTVIPAGSTLLGHVVKVESDATDQHVSSIAVTFDAVELKKKAKAPLNLSVVSAMASTAASASGNNKMVSPSAGPLPYDHPLNGQGYNVVQDSPKLINNPSGTQSALSGGSGGTPGKATAAHTGSVIGLPGVTLQIEDGPAAVSTFVSAKKNLQLESGLQLMLVVE
jgi:hypothetical protein